MPIVVGIVLIAVVVAVIAIAASRKKNQKEEPYVSTELTADSPMPGKAKGGFEQPDRPPPPKISQSIIATAKRIVEEIGPDTQRADELYNAGMAAKKAGDRETWKAKLKQASAIFYGIQERWNEEIIAEIDAALPAGCKWDAEEVANHWLGKEGGKVQKALRPLANISKLLGTD